MTTADPYINPIMAVIGILIMADPPRYINGGEADPDDEDCGWDTVGKNPTGRPRKSSARTRRKKMRRLFGGSPWDTEAPPGGETD